MNKARLETFSDGLFAIVLTLLVLDLHVPHLADATSNQEPGTLTFFEKLFNFELT